MKRQQQKDELISILWKLKNAASGNHAVAVNFHDLLHDRKARSSFLEEAANSPFSEIRHAAHRARELDRNGSLD